MSWRGGYPRDSQVIGHLQQCRRPASRYEKRLSLSEPASVGPPPSTGTVNYPRALAKVTDLLLQLVNTFIFLLTHIKTKGLAHVALRTTDFARAKAFYHDLLGLPIALDTPEVLGFLVGSTFIGFKQAQPNYPGAALSRPSRWVSTTSPLPARMKLSCTG